MSIKKIKVLRVTTPVKLQHAALVRIASHVSRSLSSSRTAANSIECFGSVAAAYLLLTSLQNWGKDTKMFSHNSRWWLLALGTSAMLKISDPQVQPTWSTTTTTHLLSCLIGLDIYLHPKQQGSMLEKTHH